MPQRSPATLAGSVVLVAVLLAPAASAVTTTSWGLADELARNPTPEDPDLSGDFGFAVDVEDDTAVVASPAAGILSGAVYVYERQSLGWQHVQTLAPSTLDSGDRFAQSLDLGRGRLVVGAPKQEVGDELNAGAAYVFVRTDTGWELDDRLTAPAPMAGARFGRAVATEGSATIVGAPSAEQAHVYRDEGDRWIHEGSLEDGTPDPVVAFGWSVDIDGPRAIVGDPLDEGPDGEPVGAAFLATKDEKGWSLGERIEPADLDSQAGVGDAVAIDGERLAVGAPHAAPTEGPEAGLVELRTVDGGSTSLDERVRPEDPANGDRFGIAVDLEGSRLVVGDPWWDRTRSGLEGDVDVGVEDEGAAFVFEQDEQGWGQTARLQVPEGDPEAELATAVAVSGTTVLAGAPDDRVHHSPRAGSAYVFERCPTADPGAPSASALGTPPCTITSEGSPTAVAGT